MIFPQIMTSLSGHEIKDVKAWEKHRRDEIFSLFEHYVYGVAPITRPKDLSFSVEEIVREEGILQKKLTISFSGYEIGADIFVPQNNKKKLPVFVMIMHEYEERNTDIDNGLDFEIVPVLEIVGRGYAIAIMKTSRICPDFFPGEVYKGAIFDVLDSERRSDSWSIISAWAWSTSRVIDYLETDKDIDKEKIISVGHSRSGKTALWAAASDTRYAMAISNDSGCTGAAFLRGKTGEHLEFINDKTNWFCDNYRKYNDDEDMLPVDQHMLLALIAPRPLYVASASKDEWSDPDAELLSCRLASEVYELYGLKGVIVDEKVKNNFAYHEGMIGYHRKEGDHAIEKYDWRMFLDFADKKFR